MLINGRKIRWDVVGIITALLVQLIAVVWFEASRSTDVVNLSKRTEELIATQKETGTTLSEMEQNISSIKGQLSVVTDILLKRTDLHMNKPYNGERK